MGLIGALLADGGPSGVAVVGHRGVGKSRLVEEAAVVAGGRGWGVRQVVGSATARQIPLGAFAAWTDDFNGDVLASTRRVIEAITAGATARVLVTVDDTHLLDDLSAFVLHQLVLQRRARVIITIRSGEPVADAVTALWKDGPLHRLELRAMSRGETEDLLKAALGAAVTPDMAHQMWNLTRGNVLFLQRLVEQERAADRLTMRDGQWHWERRVVMSRALADLVEMQIGAIPAPVLDVVDLVAVGQPIDLAVLSAVVDRAVLEEAERRGLISVGDTGLISVSNPLYAEVRLAGGPRFRQRRMRGRIATALTRPDVPPPDPLRLGELWLESDLQPDPGVFVRAAQAAFARLDPGRAERFAQAAIRAGADVTGQLLRARALTLLNRGDDAEDVLAGLAAHPQAVRARAEALDDASDAPAADFRTLRALQLAFSARPTEVVSLIEDVRPDTLPATAAVSAAWAQVIALGDLGQSRRAAAAAAGAYARAAGDPQTVYDGIALTEFHVSALTFGGEIAEACSAAERNTRPDADGLGIAAPLTTAIVGLAAAGGGDLRTALRCLTSATDQLRVRGDGTGAYYRFLIALVEVLARSGRVDEAGAAAKEMRAGAHASCSFVHANALLAEAWVTAAEGHCVQARQIAAAAADFAAEHDQAAREVVCHQVAVQLGDTTVAGRLAELAQVVEGPRAPVAARYARALARNDGAALDTASTDLEQFGDRLAAAHAAAQAAVAYTDKSLHGSALTATAGANRLLSECGAELPVGLRTTAAPPILTSREREIAALVAEGLPNKAIAEALTMSVRTVEGHVYRASNKLGLTSRAELRAFIREQL
jgi:DNA-binding CsgD family transcriptional regulator